MTKLAKSAGALKAGASLVTLLWMTAGTAAFAQDAQSDPTVTSDAAAQPGATTDQGAQAEQVPQAEEGQVTVTARRRNESLLNVPLSITAMSPERLQEQSIVSFQDLNRVAPNVILRQTNSGGGTVDAIIRGQTYAISNIANDPPVGLYFDDVIVTQNKGAGVGIFDVQSIEVSRGVQGTLRGRNNTGGAININTRRPQLDETGGEVTAAYGSRNYLQLQGILNVGVTDTLAIRVGAQRITQDGYGRSLESGQEVGGRNQWIARASALFQPSDDFSLNVTYEHIEIDQEPVGRRLIPGSQNWNAMLAGTRNGVNTSGIQRTAAQLIPTDFWDGTTNYIMPNDEAEIDFVRGTLRYDFSPELTFKVIAGYRNLFASGGIDLEGGPGLVLESAANGGSSHQFTVEPQLSGTLFNGFLTYVAGYYHFSDEGSLIAETFSYAVNNAAPTNPFRNRIVIREGATNTSDAGYAHIELHPTERLEIAGGIRYTSDVREVRPNRVNDYSYSRSSLNALYLAGTVGPVGCLFTTPVNGVLRPAGGFVIVGGNAIANGSCPSITLRTDFDYISYDLSARYRISDNLTVYARHALGQKSGGINVPIQSTVSAPFQPEEVRDYEIGLRGNRIGGVLDFSLALFYSDYTNMQRYVSSLIPGGGGIASVVINAGSATVQGIEGEFNLRPFRGMSIDGFFGYTDAAYDSFITTNATGGTVDLTNQPFLGTPEFTSRLGASYGFPVGGGELRFGGGWVHQSNASLQTIFFPGAESGTIDLVDARVSWTSDDRRWEVALYATNLLNDKYYTAATTNRTGVSSSFADVTGAYGVPGEPRFFGGTVTMRFGEH